MSSVSSKWTRRDYREWLEVPEGDAACVAFPYDVGLDVKLADESLVGVLFKRNGQGWLYINNVESDYWRFWVYGVEVTWDDLADEQRCQIRMVLAWEGRVRDYWTQLRYEDDAWYTLEVLEAL